MEDKFNCVSHYFNLRDRGVPKWLANLAAPLFMHRLDPKHGVVCLAGIFISSKDEAIEIVW